MQLVDARYLNSLELPQTAALKDFFLWPALLRDRAEGGDDTKRKPLYPSAERLGGLKQRGASVFIVYFLSCRNFIF